MSDTKPTTKILYMEQGSPEWFQARRGYLTGSQFGDLLTPARMEPSASQVKLLDRLIGERLGHDQPEDKYVSRSMQNGIDREPEARAWYELKYDCEVTKVGLCISGSGHLRCSPDGIIFDKRRALELKCPEPTAHARYLREGKLPDEYKAQCHAALICCKDIVDQVDFVSYCVGEWPHFVQPVTWTDYTSRLEEEAYKFVATLEKTIARIKA